jgi:HAD superfamily hydrolase (TIGR01493 family)
MNKWPSAVVFDVFGTLIKKVPRRVSPHARLAKMVGPSPLLDRDRVMTSSLQIRELATQLGHGYLAYVLERDLAEEIAQLRLFDDVKSTLRRLRGRGLKLAVCSNLSADYGSSVRRLLPSMDAYLLSCEVGATKPDPVIYQAVCDALACRPQDALFIGDSKRADVEGPTTFGMKAVLLERHRGDTISDALAKCLT